MTLDNMLSELEFYGYRPPELVLRRYVIRHSSEITYQCGTMYFDGSHDISKVAQYFSLTREETRERIECFYTCYMELIHSKST